VEEEVRSPVLLDDEAPSLARLQLPNMKPTVDACNRTPQSKKKWQTQIETIMIISDKSKK
jgi:hypothetical protein